LVLLITEDDVKELMDSKRTIHSLESAFSLQSQGHVQMPNRQVMKEEGSSAVVRVMPASVPGLNALGVKLLLGVPATRKVGSTYFATMVFDTIDGSLLAIVAANRLTQLRTGAASGIATKHLAKSDAKSVGILGAGVQGYGQLEGVSASIPIETAMVYDIDKAKVESMINRARDDLGITLKKAENAETIYENDVICTATPSSEPILFGNRLNPGTHINAIGSNAPNRQEIDLEVLRRSRIFVDKLEQTLEEAGDIVIPIKRGQFSADRIAGNLCDVITGKVRGRESASQVTLFKSVGIAIEDVSVARSVYEAALEKGSGKEISF